MTMVVVMEANTVDRLIDKDYLDVEGGSYTYLA